MLFKTYETPRLLLKTLEPSHAEAVLDYYLRNKEFLEEWEPVRDAHFYTIETQKKQLEEDIKQIKDKNMLKLWIFKKDNEDKIIGSLAFSNIIYGAFLSCFVGYKLDSNEINKGYMTEALNKGIEIMFKEYGLHRIEANIMPKNKRSLSVVRKLDFKDEGIAHSYLKINGVWENHIHMVLINDEL